LTSCPTAVSGGRFIVSAVLCITALTCALGRGKGSRVPRPTTGTRSASATSTRSRTTCAGMSFLLWMRAINHYEKKMRKQHEVIE
jgi:hypothetical protein